MHRAVVKEVEQYSREKVAITATTRQRSAHLLVEYIEVIDHGASPQFHQTRLELRINHYSSRL